MQRTVISDILAICVFHNNGQCGAGTMCAFLHGDSPKEGSLALRKPCRRKLMEKGPYLVLLPFRMFSYVRGDERSSTDHFSK